MKEKDHYDAIVVVVHQIHHRHHRHRKWQLLFFHYRHRFTMLLKFQSRKRVQQNPAQAQVHSKTHPQVLIQKCIYQHQCRHYRTITMVMIAPNIIPMHKTRLISYKSLFRIRSSLCHDKGKTLIFM